MKRISILLVCFVFLMACEKENILLISEQEIPVEPTIIETNEPSLEFRQGEKSLYTGQGFGAAEVFENDFMFIVVGEDSLECVPNGGGVTGTVGEYVISMAGTIGRPGTFSLLSSFAQVEYNGKVESGMYDRSFEDCQTMAPELIITETTDSTIIGLLSTEYFIPSDSTASGPVDCKTWTNVGTVVVDFNIPYTVCQ